MKAAHRGPQTLEVTVGAGAPRAFPPRRDYASLSVRDLLDARRAYHVHLASLENVVATAIGRYLIRREDWYDTHAPDEPRPADVPKERTARTLENSVVRPWSWPAVLVFVRDWKQTEELGSDAVPRTLYLPDGRVVPTCVVLATPDESLPPPAVGPSQASGLLGGGYSCLRHHQGVDNLGTFGCLVYRQGTYYALTNRHVAGGAGEEIRASVRGEYRKVGTSVDVGVGRRPFGRVFPRWGDDDTLLVFDAGLVQIDDLHDWTSQAWGIGEIGEVFDATEGAITLDLIGCPVRAFGGTSGVMEGEIRALFFRYETLGGFDHTTDVLVGSRTDPTGARTATPFTRPGDSGTLWFYDPPVRSGAQTAHPDVDVPLPPDRGARARRLRPIAMQWGGQRTRIDGATSAFALASFVSSICTALDVRLVRGWSTGHDEYWGKLGHFAIGWKACGLVAGTLGTLMLANQARVGFGDVVLGEGSGFRMGRGAYVPLADVPDYVWIHGKGRGDEGVQHFADIDIVDIDGGPTMLARCVADPRNVSATVWKAYFGGFADAGVGPDEGTLPFRVWQIWDAMVAYLQHGDVKRFVAAAGVLAHYIGDASQPLHCSWLHHGKPPTRTRHGRKYPVRHGTPQWDAFADTGQYKIHGIYEETMLEVDTSSALQAVNDDLAATGLPASAVASGHDAAVATIRLMDAVQQRLSPQTIIDADDPSDTVPARARALWANATIRNATVASLADSVRLLAALWTTAWEAGNGAAVKATKIREYSEDELAAVYRHDEDFVPSLSLEEMATGGKFEAP